LNSELRETKAKIIDVETLTQRKEDELKGQHTNELNNLKAALTSEIIERLIEKYLFSDISTEIDP
jgi:hypothetical protein